MDSFAVVVSLALQHGVPLEALVNKFRHTRFEPSGVTRNPEIPIAKSVVDSIFRWLELRFLVGGVSEQVVVETADSPRRAEPAVEKTGFAQETDAPPCSSCGSITVRSGTCHLCLTCGSTSGCS